jgi:hypothetical protein
MFKKKKIPDLCVQFSDAKFKAVVRKIEELDEAVIWLMRDMEKIATREIPINQVNSFAKQSIKGLTAYLTNDLR